MVLCGKRIKETQVIKVMKIGIITFSDRNNMPYLKYYEDIIRKEKVDYECIFWDRFANGETEKTNNEYTLHIKCLPGANKLGKIIPMLKYKYIIEEIIKKEQYTHLIILTTLPGVLINKLLLKQFKNKYILDIRDYTYEKYTFYKKIVDKLVDNSFFAAISSKGFLRFLNDNERIITCHNISNVEEIKETCADFRNKKQITIGFLGNIRYFEENCKLIDALANNPKYKLVYIGKPNVDCDLEGYCKNKSIKNVVFKGEFKNEDKPKLYKEIDLINALYGNDRLEVTTALPNRLYDGILFKKPVIATKGTYLGDIVDKFHLGIFVDINSSFFKKYMDDYIKDFKKFEFNRSCEYIFKIIEKEQKSFYKRITGFCYKNDNK